MNDIQRALRLLGLATLVLYLAGIALGVYVLIKTNETTRALCSFRGDLQQRVDTTQTYLDAHPGSEPFPGVSRISILQSLSNQRRTIDALSNLNCEGG